MARILVMDDDEGTRTAIQRLLESRGHAVLAYEDAEPALREVNFEEVDLAISDLQMPTPGDQFLLILQQDNIDVPVIIISAYLNEERIEYLEELGAAKILAKPLEMVNLMEVVEDVLS